VKPFYPSNRSTFQTVQLVPLLGGGDNAGFGADAEVVSEEEYATLLRLKELKRDYRELYEELKGVKSEVGYTVGRCTLCILLTHILLV
jgi:hypothetical protein